MAKLGSSSSEQDSAHQDPDIDPNCVEPASVQPGSDQQESVQPGSVQSGADGDHGDEDALRGPAEYTDLLNTDWIERGGIERGDIERGGEAASAEDEQGFDFDIELSGARDSDFDEEGVNLFDVDVGSLLTSSPVEPEDFDAGPLDPLVAEGLIDLRASVDGELSDQAAEDLEAQAGLHGLSLPGGTSSSGLDVGDEAVGDDERFPVFDDAPGVVPPDWADDTGQEGIAEEAD